MVRWRWRRRGGGGTLRLGARRCERLLEHALLLVQQRVAGDAERRLRPRGRWWCRRMRRRLLEEEVDRTAHVARRRLQRDGRLLLREAHRDERRDSAIQHCTRFFRFVGFGLFPTAVSRQHHRCRRSLRVRDASTQGGRTDAEVVNFGFLGPNYFGQMPKSSLHDSGRLSQDFTCGFRESHIIHAEMPNTAGGVGKASSFCYAGALLTMRLLGRRASGTKTLPAWLAWLAPARPGTRAAQRPTRGEASCTRPRPLSSRART